MGSRGQIPGGRVAVEHVRWALLYFRVSPRVRFCLLPCHAYHRDRGEGRGGFGLTYLRMRSTRPTVFYIVAVCVLVFVLEIQFKLGHPQPPESVCSLPCEVGQAKKYVEGERCCWHCFNCTQYQVRQRIGIVEIINRPSDRPAVISEPRTLSFQKDAGNNAAHCWSAIVVSVARQHLSLQCIHLTGNRGYGNDKK